MKQKIFIFSTIIILVFIVVYLSINEYNKPYKTVATAILEAKDNKNESTVILKGDEFHRYNGEHRKVYEINWNEFKSDINEGYKINYKTKVPILLKIRRGYSQTSRYINVYFYDKSGVEVNRIRLLVEKVNGQWKIIGRLKIYEQNSKEDNTEEDNKYAGVWKTRKKNHDSKWYADTRGEIIIDKDGTLMGKIASVRVTDGYLSREANIEFTGNLDSEKKVFTFDNDMWDHGGEVELEFKGYEIMANVIITKEPEYPLNWSIKEGILVFVRDKN